MKRAPRKRGALFALRSVLRQGTVDGAECVVDFGSKPAHHSDHNDGDEREDYRVLDEPPLVFLGCKQHNNLPQFQRPDYLLYRRLHIKT